MKVLEERAKHPEQTIAWLYNPETMPKGLEQAHAELDEVVDRIYRPQPFRSNTERLEMLFRLYSQYLSEEKMRKPKKK